MQVSIESEKHNHLLHCAARPIPDAALEAQGIHLHEVLALIKLRLGLINLCSITKNWVCLISLGRPGSFLLGS